MIKYRFVLMAILLGAAIFLSSCSESDEVKAVVNKLYQSQRNEDWKTFIPLWDDQKVAEPCTRPALNKYEIIENPEIVVEIQTQSIADKANNVKYAKTTKFLTSIRQDNKDWKNADGEITLINRGNGWKITKMIIRQTGGGIGIFCP